MNELEKLKSALASVGVEVNIPSLDLILNTITKYNELKGKFSIDDATQLVEENRNKYQP